LTAVLGVEVFAVLPDDASGAALASGAWTVGGGARRSPLARSARPLAALIAEAMSGREWVVPINVGESSEATG